MRGDRLFSFAVTCRFTHRETSTGAETPASLTMNARPTLDPLFRHAATKVLRVSRLPIITTSSCPKTETNSRLARRAVSIVIDPWRAPDLGRVGGDVGDSGSPYAQGKHRPATGCHAPGRRPESRPGPHLDQDVLGPSYAAVTSASILDPSGGLFSDAARPPVSGPLPPLAQTWHSKIEIRDQYRK